MRPEELSRDLSKGDGEEKVYLCGKTQKEINSLRDSYIGRLPAQQSSATVSYAWRELWSKVVHYFTWDALKALGETLVVAAQAHGEQMRSGGEPYIIHPINAASILADMKLDLETLQGALLHDVLEDTDYTEDMMRQQFGDNVTTLVDGVTKLGKLNFKSVEDYQAENLRKMFLVMARDIRVVLIKLADRTHNLRSLGACRREKQIRKAKETLEIYAPLAHRLGIYQMKRVLEDLSFKYYDPVMYYEIKDKVAKKLPQREELVALAMKQLQEKLDSMGIRCSIKGRAKHFYSIFEKMNRKKISMDQLYDLLALRVIVDDLPTCYTVLGIVHTLWKPIPGQFDDYIANPKNNMYQSLHSTVVGPKGEPIEVQIRTWDMHWSAEYGVAAHWRYKEGAQKEDDIESKLEWIRHALEGGKETNPSEFMERLKDDVFTNDVFVFTPDGDVKNLPRGATPVDFAYAVHSEVGAKFVGAMVNNRIVASDYELQNGEIVKIMTSSNGRPSRDWLKFVKSSKAKSKIRAYFKQLDNEAKKEDIQRGEELLQHEMRHRLDDPKLLITSMTAELNRVARDMNAGAYEDLFWLIGSGGLTVAQVASKLTHLVISPSDGSVDPEKGKPRPKLQAQGDSDVVVEGANGIQVTLAHCCKPVPGDAISGFVTKGHGIMVHRSDCPRLKSKEDHEGRVVELHWANGISKLYEARIVLDALDRPGLFADVARICANLDVNIDSVKATQIGTNTSNARMRMDLRVRDLEQLYSLIAKLNTIRSVIDVNRG